VRFTRSDQRAYRSAHPGPEFICRFIIEILAATSRTFRQEVGVGREILLRSAKGVRRLWNFNFQIE
jgi:hypothetical protein